MFDPAFTLDKKTAIVVGAANGIGRATALAFAAAGAAVACADIEEPGAKATAAEIDAGGGRALPVHLDVTDGASCRAAVAATVERLGGLDVLLNLTGAFLMVKAALPAMIARGGGSVILIASCSGATRTWTRRAR